MPIHRFPHRAVWMLALIAAAPAAHAQWAVVDVGAIAQLIQEVQVLEQTLSTAQSELSQARQTFRSMTGGRGMESLLAGTARNYLPGSAGELQALLAGSATSFGSLAGSMQALMDQDAVLSAVRLASLPPQEAAQLVDARRTTALLQAITGEALANASGRFAALQQLVSAIGGASDEKAVLDLDARIAAEQTMLTNEQTKLAVLQRALEAQQWSDRLRTRERIIALHGEFGSRFTPVP